MTLIPPIGQEVEANQWRLAPIEVLFDFDGPEVFTVRSPFGGLMLAYLCASDSTRREEQYLLVPTDTDTLADLERSRLALRDALDVPHCWLVTATFDGQIEVVHSVATADLPEDARPLPGLTLAGERIPSSQEILASLEREASRGQQRSSLIDYLWQPRWGSEAA